MVVRPKIARSEIGWSKIARSRSGPSAIVRRWAGPLAALGLGALAPLAAASPAAADVDVVLDQAKVVRITPKVSTVIIGNPAIADITIQRATGIMIVTGKTYGSTNMIMLDDRGQTLREDQVIVRAGNDRIVTVQRGLDRESLACRPVCERTVTVGDDEKSFAAATGQISARSSLAIGQSVAPTAAGAPR